MSSSEQTRDAGTGGRSRSEAGVELPVVIRPQALCLSDLEQLVRCDHALARALAARPQFRRSLARAVHGRDARARTRFASVDALERYLCVLHAG